MLPPRASFFSRSLWGQKQTFKQYLILYVATTDVKRADRAATQPLQTRVSQSLTITQVKMVQFTQPDKLGKDMTQKTAIWNYLTDQIEACAFEYSHIPLCNPHDRYVSDATAVTDIQLSQLGGWGTFSQALDPNITHPETQTVKPLHHAMSWKRTQSKTTAATNTPTCYKVRCPGVAGSWGRPQIWGWRRSFWGTLRRGVCGGLVSCCTGPSSWCLSLGCYLKSEQRIVTSILWCAYGNECRRVQNDLTLGAKSLQFGNFSDGFQSNVGKMRSIQQRNGRKWATSGN